MDDKDIKMLKLLFDNASSDGEKKVIINMLNKKYNNDVVSNIIKTPINKTPYEGLYKEGYIRFKTKYNEILDLFDTIVEENAFLKTENEKLISELSHAKFCSVFWFIIMIVVNIFFAII